MVTRQITRGCEQLSRKSLLRKYPLHLAKTYDPKLGRMHTAVLYLRRSRYDGYTLNKGISVRTYFTRGRIFKTEERSDSTSGARRNPLQSATSSSSLSNISAEQLETILLPKSGLAESLIMRLGACTYFIPTSISTQSVIVSYISYF